MYHFFSLPFIFGTISPSMRDSRLAIRMCYSRARQEQELPSIHTRTKLITNNPIAAAQVFDRVMRAFFAIIAGIPLSDFTGKRANVDRLLFANRDKFTQVVLLPMGCPINESNNMAVQRRNTDRQTDRQTDGHFF